MSIRSEHAVGLYLDGIRDGNARQALVDHVGARYVQHSTGVADGKDGFLAFFEAFLERNPQRDITVLRVIEEGHFVFLHVAQTLNTSTRWVTADLFDTDDEGRVIEHWDVIAAGGLSTPSGHTQTDGPTEVTDLHLTARNKALVAEFVEVVLQNGDIARAADYLDSESFVQHNPLVADGIDGLREFVERLVASGRPMVYHTVHRLIGQGNFVVAFSEVLLGDDAMAVFDVFRVADGRIVEHWDLMEPVPDAAAAGNSGKF